MRLTETDKSILRELRKPDHGGWLCSAELAIRMDRPGWAIRTALQALHRNRLVERGDTRNGGAVGEWSITERGILDLCAVDQLRLVP